MKTTKARLALVCVSIVIVGLVFAGQSSARIDPKTCVGAWLFDEGRGDIAEDSSGNDNNGKVVDAKWVDGKFGKALEFKEAGDSYVLVPQSKELSPEIYTVTAWINVPGPSGWQTIVAKDEIELGPEKRTYGMFVIRGAVGIHYSFKDKAGNHHTVNGTAVAADGDWHHIAMTYDGKILRGYVDGVLDTKQAFPGPPIMHEGAVTIGGEHGGRYALKGAIDEVYISKAVLDEDEIKELLKGLKALLAVDPSSTALTTTWASIKAQ